MTRNLRRLEPVAVKGAQGLFTVPEALVQTHLFHVEHGEGGTGA